MSFLRVFLTVFVLALAGAGTARAQSLDEVTLNDGRRYLVALPAGVDRPPLIVGLHGGGGSPEQFARDSGLARVALANGFAVVFPAGSGRGRLLTWNGGYCCAFAADRGIDDVGFLARVIADAGRRFGVDGDRVFLTGMSNGAIMAQTYAAAAPPGSVAGVASVAGTLDLSRYQPRSQVPLLHIHGTNDENVPYGGGVGPESIVGTDFTSVADAVAAFRRPFGAMRSAGDVIDPADDGMRVERTVWSAGGVPRVILMTVVGGGHHWPGGIRSSRRGATRDIDASREAVRFFRALL
jgi:polyhydroxybutyrate depolymerase